MTYERATEILDPEHRETYESLEIVNEACRMGRAALFRRMPEPPHPDGDESILACPTCGSGEYLYNEDGNRCCFCGWCGQAIDWNAETFKAAGQMKPVLKYPGSKWRLAEWIVSLMPPHKSYLEPFFGSGAVFFKKPPSRIETINDLELSLFKGNDHIFELMEDLKFKVGPKSFYQTNTEQAYHLYCVAREFANLTGDELVYDLYTGTGTIANFVAHKAKKVIGIEYVPEAIEDAKVNSQVNNIENTLFYAGDMKDILTNDFIAQHGRPDVIITDPPRAGMHPDVVNVILNAAPNRIVYVSCNPATQARDLQLMDDHYKVAAVQPVDMFPHTPHVENVVLLEKRSDAEIKQKLKERKEREKAIAEAKAAKEAEKLAAQAAQAEDLTEEELAAKK